VWEVGYDREVEQVVAGSRGGGGTVTLAWAVVSSILLLAIFLNLLVASYQIFSEAANWTF
jgi:hypothetical protein